MIVFVLDSNIISYFLKGHKQIAGSIAKELKAGNKVLVAPMAYYEVKRGLMAVKSEKRLKEFLDFCEEFGVGQFDNCVLDVAAEIYVEQKNQGRPLEDADILIAAFCKCHGFALVTHNIKHFEHIADLQVFDWVIE